VELVWRQPDFRGVRSPILRPLAVNVTRQRECLYGGTKLTPRLPIPKSENVGFQSPALYHNKINGLKRNLRRVAMPAKPVAEGKFHCFGFPG